MVQNVFVIYLFKKFKKIHFASSSDGSVILQSPVFPVFEGNNVTLRCISKTTHINQSANFYKDDGLIDRSPSDNMEINSVSRSDEGRYKCSISGVGTSPESWLHVRCKAKTIFTYFCVWAS